MNKKGKGAGISSSMALRIGVLFVAVVVAAMFFMYKSSADDKANAAAIAKVQAEAQAAKPEPTDTGSAGDACPDTSITTSYAFNDVLQSSTSLSDADVRVRLNGAPAVPSTTAYGYKDNLEMLVNNTGYENLRIIDYVIPCKANTVPGGMYAVGQPTYTIFNDAGNAVTNSTGDGAANNASVNQSAIVSGGSVTLEFRRQGTDLKSTGAQRCVIEAVDSTKVDKIIMTGFEGVTNQENGVTIGKPSIYSSKAAGAQQWIYDLPALIGAGQESGSLTVQLKSSQTYNGNPVYTQCYSKQWFEDTDGSFKYGIENSLGVAKHGGTSTAAFAIAAE